MTSPNNFDDKLRQALGAAPGEWRPDTDSAQSVLGELHRRRTRRHLVMGSAVATVLLVAGLATALGQSATTNPPRQLSAQAPEHGIAPTTTEPGSSKTAGPQRLSQGSGDIACVAVGVGSQPASCGGSINSDGVNTPGAISSSGQTSLGVAPTPGSASVPPASPSAAGLAQTMTPLVVAVGQRVSISLPARPGTSWSAPTVVHSPSPQTQERSASSQSATTGALRLVAKHVDLKSGTARATFQATQPGSVVLQAQSSQHCGSGKAAAAACAKAAAHWSIVIEVVKR